MKQAQSTIFLNNLFKQIYTLHKLPKKHFSKFKKIDFAFYHTNIDKLPNNIKNKYLEIFSKHKDDPLVINHSDINLANIIYSCTKQIHLIDFE